MQRGRTNDIVQTKLEFISPYWLVAILVSFPEVDVSEKAPMHAIYTPPNMVGIEGYIHNILGRTSRAPERLLSKPHFWDGN